MKNGDARWTAINAGSKDGITDGSYVVNGDPRAEKSIWQEIPLYARKGQMITYGAKAEARAVTAGEFGVKAKFYYRGETGAEVLVGEDFVGFVNEVSGHEQVAMKSYPLAGDCTHMRLYICYYKQPANEPNGANHAMKVHDAFVFATAGGTKYEYYKDDQGRNTNKIKTMSTGAGTMELSYNSGRNSAEVREIKITRPDGTVETKKMTYDNRHNMTEVTETRIVKTINNQGGVETEEKTTKTKYAYKDTQYGGVLESVAVSDGSAQSKQIYSYDSDNNNIIAVEDDGSKLKATFNYRSKNVNVIDAYTDFGGTTYNYDYNPDQFLSSIRSADSKNSYGYDDNRLAMVKSHSGVSGCTGKEDDNCMAYTFEYNEFGQLIQSEIDGNAIAANTYYAYDDPDNKDHTKTNLLRETKYANGAMGSYVPGYDNRGRVISETYDGAGIANFEYVYGDSGVISQVRNNEPGTNRTTQFGYDFAGRLTDILTQSNNSDNQSRVRLHYTNDGALENLKATANGLYLSESWFAYDELGRPIAAQLGTLDDSIASYQYTTLNRLSVQTITLPGEEKIVTSSGYFGETNFVKTLKTTLPNAEQFKYEYAYTDKADKSKIEDTKIISVVENDGETTHTYEYDSIGQLTKDTAVDSEGTKTVLEYTYNKGGNLTSIAEDGQEKYALKYNANGWTDQLAKFGDKKIAYDKLGNLKEYDGNSYTWEKGGLLKNIKGSALDASYVYDYNGLRSKKTVNGGAPVEYGWAGSLLVAEISDDYTIAWTYDAAGKMVGFTLDDTAYFYVRNLQGDVVGIIDADGELVARYTYDAWGNILEVEDLLATAMDDILDDELEDEFDDDEYDDYDDYDAASYSVAQLNPIRYRGYYWDAETGYYYCQSRYYNPEWCRWISADVFFDTGDGAIGTNMYAYCNNNPVMYKDPTGRDYDTATEFNPIQFGR